MAKDIFLTNCIYWKGRTPCIIQKTTKQKNCRNCSAYKPCRKNILIIKTGGLGSIIRSIVVAQEFQYKFEKDNCRIQYLTHKKGVDLLKHVSAVDDALDIDDWKSLNFLTVQKFDIVVNFECSKMALVAAGKIIADSKFGFLPDFKGSPYIKRSNNMEIVKLQTDDFFRKNINKKCMQQIFLETAGLIWKKQRYQLCINEADNAYAKKIFSKINIIQKNKIIGLNIGSSRKQRKKRWDIKRFMALINIIISNHPDWKIVILAGPEEVDLYEKVYFFCRENFFTNVIFPGCHNTIGQFIAIVNHVNLVVSCDTFGMHVAIALGKKVITLNGPQPIQETEIYGLGEKLKSQVFCSPCFLVQNNCSGKCMKINESIVYQAILRTLNLLK